MIPADERLEPSNVLPVEAHDRLVVQTELVVVDAAPQLCLELQPRHGAVVHLRVEDLVARAALPFGAVHGDLGMITGRDVVLALSNSGTTPEILTIVPLIKRMGVPLVALARTAGQVTANLNTPEKLSVGLTQAINPVTRVNLGFEWDNAGKNGHFKRFTWAS